ncbi:MAG: autotransporter outer membrane beta-barrel domain-containing protein [Hyphomicrobiaceae bacterium]|nr:autotransporter outer membrane beta-barrel domain-containing protein [Hyphomicrobiaceae bacterium]
MLVPGAAFAQCTDTFNFVGDFGGGVFRPVQSLLPLGSGSSLAVLTSTINTVNSAFLASSSAFVAAPGNPKPDERGSGVWARGIAGNVETKTTSTGVLDGSGLASPIAATGTQNCKTTIKQSYSGFQLGYDIAVLNRGGSGANWHFGVTGGQVQARLNDATPGTTYTSSTSTPVTLTVGDGQLTQDTLVPYVGLYTTFTNKGFFADAMVRWDFFRNTFTDPGNGVTSQKGFNANGFALLGNMGQSFALRDGWFVEPSGGLMYSRVSVDSLSVVGFTNYATGTVAFSDIESLLGRLTFRIGRNFTHGNMAYQPFFTAGLYHEFLGSVTATSIANTNGVNTDIDGLKLTSTSKDGLGTYGQFSLGTAIVHPNNVTTFVRGDYRTGEHVEGWGVNGGVRFNF